MRHTVAFMKAFKTLSIDACDICIIFLRTLFKMTLWSVQIGHLSFKSTLKGTQDFISVIRCIFRLCRMVLNLIHHKMIRWILVTSANMKVVSQAEQVVTVGLNITKTSFFKFFITFTNECVHNMIRNVLLENEYCQF